MFQPVSLKEENIIYAPAKKRNSDEFVKIAKVDGVLVSASISSYFTAHLYHKQVRDMAVLDAIEAIDRWWQLDPLGKGTRILQSCETDDYDSLWVVSDKQGITFMFPEEF